MKVLLIDDDSDVREIIAFTIESQLNCEIVEVDSGNAAVETLKSSLDFQLIVCDYNMPNGNGGVVYQYLIEQDIDIPYVFCSSDYASDHPEFEDKSKLMCEITKPKIFEGVETMVESLNDFKVDRNESFDSKNNDDFCQASLELISNCNQLPCEIFIRVGQNTLKAFNQNDSLTQDDIVKYQSKGVNSLLVKRADSRKFVQFIADKVLSILQDKNLESEEKVLSAHDVIMETIRELGMSDSVARAAKSSVDFTLKFFDQNEKTKDLGQLLFGDPKRGYLTTHSVGISYISVGLLKHTTWDSPDNRNKLVMAGFMHDMSIRKPEFSESLFSEESDLMNLKDHTAQTVELLKPLQDIPEDVFKIIADHHERPDGSGIPRGISGNQLAPLTSVFIFSHDIIDAMLELKNRKEKITFDSVKKFLDQCDYSHGKFPKILEAFQKANLFEDV